MSAEVWKLAEPGIYASSHGRIRVGEKICPLSLTGKYARVGRGYLATRIHGKLLKAHRLVAIAFHENPNGLPQVNHKNGITTDNRAENLEWATNQDNQRHATATGLHVALYGEQVTTAKITAATARAIRKAIQSGKHQRATAALFGISKTQVGRIARKEAWRRT